MVLDKNESVATLGNPAGHPGHGVFHFLFCISSKGETMFFPFIGISAAAIALLQLGALAVTVVYLKALLAVAVAVALLLGLALIARRHKDQ